MSTRAQQVQQIFDAAALVQHLGMKLEKVEEGKLEVSLQVRPEMRQQHGYVHAGVIATLGDHAAGGAARSVTGERDVITIEFKINFFRPAMGPELRAIARVLKAGKSVAVAEAEIIDSSGKVVAKLTETLQVLGASSHSTGDQA